MQCNESNCFELTAGILFLLFLVLFSCNVFAGNETDEIDTEYEGCQISWKSKVPGGGLEFWGYAFSCKCDTYWEGIAMLDGSIAPGHWLNISGDYSFNFMTLPPQPPNVAKAEFMMRGIGKGTRCNLLHEQAFRIRFEDSKDSIRITEVMGRFGHATGMCDGITVPVFPALYPAGFDVVKKPFRCGEVGLDPGAWYQRE